MKKGNQSEETKRKPEGEWQQTRAKLLREAGIFCSSLVEKADVIYIDTCSLMSVGMPSFMNLLIPALRKNGKKVTLFSRVLREIRFHSENPSDFGTKVKAINARLCIKKLMEESNGRHKNEAIVDYSDRVPSNMSLAQLDEKSKKFADPIFIDTVTETFNSNGDGHSVLVITSDNKLIEALKNNYQSAEYVNKEPLYIASVIYSAKTDSGYLNLRFPDESAPKQEQPRKQEQPKQPKPKQQKPQPKPKQQKPKQEAADKTPAYTDIDTLFTAIESEPVTHTPDSAVNVDQMIEQLNGATETGETSVLPKTATADSRAEASVSPKTATADSRAEASVSPKTATADSRAEAPASKAAKRPFRAEAPTPKATKSASTTGFPIATESTADAKNTVAANGEFELKNSAECIVGDCLVIPVGYKRLVNASQAAITRIDIPNTLTAISGNALRGSMLKEIQLPDSVCELGELAFADCTALEKAIVPGSVKMLKQGCFKNCSSLSDITLQEGLEIISREAFMGCSSLTGLFIPNSVIMIDSMAFKNCPELVILCHEDSFAQTFAINTQMRFEIV